MFGSTRLYKKLVYGNEVGAPLTPFYEIADLQGLMKRCHDIIRDNENLSPIPAFAVMTRMLYAKQFDEIKTPKGLFYQFQTIPSESDADLADRIQSLYTRAIGAQTGPFDSRIGIRRSETAGEVTKILESLSFASMELDTKGEAYQSFLSKAMRGPSGQYFTPREVVRPIVQMISPEENERIIDPCCGTGGFLIYCSQYLRETHRKGETNPIIRKNDDLTNFTLIGIEVDRNVAESCIISMTLEGESHGRVVLANALSDFDDPNLEGASIEKNSFDVVLTNPPFGKKTRLGDVLKCFKLSSAYKIPPFESILIERCLELLKPGGRCAIVLPDIALTSEPLLDFLHRNAILQAVVSLPPETFKPYGPSVKASVLYFKKKIHVDDEPGKVFMARVDQIGYDSTGRKSSENKFEDIIPLFKRFLKEGTLETTRKDGFLCFVEDGSDSQIFDNLRVEAHYSPVQEARNFVPLSEVAKVLRGFTPAWEDYEKQGIPILKVKNLHNRNIDFSFERRGYVSEETYENHPEAHVQVGDIVLTASAHSPEYIAKKIDIIDSLPLKECMAVAELIIIRADRGKIDPFYLVSVLRRKEINEQFRTCIRGTTAHIYPRDVAEKILIPRLPLDSQRKIGNLLREALVDFRRLEGRYHNFENELDRLLFGPLSIGAETPHGTKEANIANNKKQRI